MTRFRISLAILLILLGISIGSMAAVRYSGNAVLEAVQQVSETASPTAAQCEAVETAWEKAEPWLLLSVRRDKLMDTSNSVYRLKPLLESDCDEFTAEPKRLTEQSAISDTRRGLFVPDAVLTKKQSPLLFQQDAGIAFSTSFKPMQTRLPQLQLQDSIE